MKPTSGAQATFGGAVGYTINPNATGQTPLTIAAPSGQTVDILDVTLNAVKVLDIDSVGDTEVGGNLELLATSRTSATDVALWNDNGATNGLVLNVPTGSTNGFQFQVNGANKFTISNAGAVTASAGVTGTTGTFSAAVSGTTGTFSGAVSGTTITGTGLGTFVGATAGTGTVKGASDGATNTFLPPVYTAGGAAVASTAHIVVGTASFSAASTVTVNLTGAAQFVSGTSYAVYTDNGTGTWPLAADGASRGVMLQVDTKTATSFRIVAATSGLNTAQNITATIPFVAIGT